MLSIIVPINHVPGALQSGVETQVLELREIGTQGQTWSFPQASLLWSPDRLEIRLDPEGQSFDIPDRSYSRFALITQGVPEPLLNFWLWRNELEALSIRGNVEVRLGMGEGHANHPLLFETADVPDLDCIQMTGADIPGSGPVERLEVLVGVLRDVPQDIATDAFAFSLLTPPSDAGTVSPYNAGAQDMAGAAAGSGASNKEPIAPHRLKLTALRSHQKVRDLQLRVIFDFTRPESAGFAARVHRLVTRNNQEEVSAEIQARINQSTKSLARETTANAIAKFPMGAFEDFRAIRLNLSGAGAEYLITETTTQLDLYAAYETSDVIAVDNLLNADLKKDLQTIGYGQQKRALVDSSEKMDEHRSTKVIRLKVIGAGPGGSDLLIKLTLHLMTAHHLQIALDFGSSTRAAVLIDRSETAPVATSINIGPILNTDSIETHEGSSEIIVDIPGYPKSENGTDSNPFRAYFEQEELSFEKTHLPDTIRILRFDNGIPVDRESLTYGCFVLHRFKTQLFSGVKEVSIDAGLDNPIFLRTRSIFKKVLGLLLQEILATSEFEAISKKLGDGSTEKALSLVMTHPGHLPGSVHETMLGVMHEVLSDMHRTKRLQDLGFTAAPGRHFALVRAFPEPIAVFRNLCKELAAASRNVPETVLVMDIGHATFDIALMVRDTGSNVHRVHRCISFELGGGRTNAALSDAVCDWLIRRADIGGDAPEEGFVRFADRTDVRTLEEYHQGVYGAHCIQAAKEAPFFDPNGMCEIEVQRASDGAKDSFSWLPFSLHAAISEKNLVEMAADKTGRVRIPWQDLLNSTSWKDNYAGLVELALDDVINSLERLTSKNGLHVELAGRATAFHPLRDIVERKICDFGGDRFTDFTSNVSVPWTTTNLKETKWKVVAGAGKLAENHSILNTHQEATFWLIDFGADGKIVRTTQLNQSKSETSVTASGARAVIVNLSEGLATALKNCTNVSDQTRLSEALMLQATIEKAVTPNSQSYLCKCERQRTSYADEFRWTLNGTIQTFTHYSYRQ